ncbi:MAG: hypothetical protein AAF316_05670 [Cyanobacteria bacterium P01_A01_bin.80]
MRIVMLGHSGVGKTTFMASLYGIMQQKIEGFSLKTEDAEVGRELKAIAQDISSNRYPPATAIRTEYSFSLQYQGKDIFPFVWSDYRGGAIRSRQVDAEDSAKLVNEIREADGIMMFCDCESLLNKKENATKNEIRRMTYLVNQAVENIDRPISLAIVLTKIDKISRFDPRLFKLFEGLIGVINASNWILASFIPVSCGSTFINVPIPLMYALRSSVIYHLKLAEHLVQHHCEEYEKYTKSSKGISGAIKWARDSWNGYTTDAENARKALLEAYQIYQVYESIKDPVIALATYLEKIPMIEEKNNLQAYISSCETLQFHYSLPGFVVKTRSKQENFGWF